MCYIQTVEYYSALKINELSNHEKIWKNRTCIFLRERSQSEKATYCMISTILQRQLTDKIMDTVKDSEVAKD